MTEIEMLTKQTESVYGWTNKLIETISFEHWETIPEIIESNISWQVGHLIMSHYFHSVMVIAGHQMDVIQKIPLKEYDELFTNAEPKKSIGKVNPPELIWKLKVVQQKSMDSMEELESRLEPTPTPHPIAKTKLEAIEWNIQHTMYHCGQIGVLKRVLGERYDFGLRRPE